MNNFTELVEKKFLKAVNLHSMIPENANVVVGFSGGADSVCLIHLLNKFRRELKISALTGAHLNHGIRGEEAKRDELFCKSFCENNNITFALSVVNCPEISRQTGESVEECGRRMRYTFFESLSDENTKIATAHNLNDNAETLLFNLARGASLKGLSGIPYVRGNVIRPVLDISREEIECYCSENGLDFVIDSTNLQDSYTRNKIRHKILPMLCEINASALLNIVGFSSKARSADEYISAQAEIHLEKARLCKNTYDAAYLLSLNEFLAKVILIKAFSDFCSKTLESKKVDEIYFLLKAHGRIQIYGRFCCEVIKGKLRFFESPQPDDVHNNEEIVISNFPFSYLGKTACISLDVFSKISKNINNLSYENLIDSDKITGNLVLRYKKEGDEITLCRRKVTKSLKKLFSEHNVPVEMRNYVPVLCDSKGVVWVMGFGVNLPYAVTPETSNIISVRGKYNDK